MSTVIFCGSEKSINCWMYSSLLWNHCHLLFTPPIIMWLWNGWIRWLFSS